MKDSLKNKLDAFKSYSHNPHLDWENISPGIFEAVEKPKKKNRKGIWFFYIGFGILLLFLSVGLYITQSISTDLDQRTSSEAILDVNYQFEKLIEATDNYDKKTTHLGDKYSELDLPQKSFANENKSDKSKITSSKSITKAYEADNGLQKMNFVTDKTATKINGATPPSFSFQLKRTSIAIETLAPLDLFLDNSSYDEISFGIKEPVKSAEISRNSNTYVSLHSSLLAINNFNRLLSNTVLDHAQSYELSMQHTRPSGLSLYGGISFTNINHTSSLFTNDTITIRRNTLDTVIISSSHETYVYSDSSSALRSIRFRNANSTKIVSVPLMVGYSIQKGRIGLSAALGLDMAIYTHNRGTTISKENEIENIGSKIKASPLGYRGSISLDYNISDKFSLSSSAGIQFRGFSGSTTTSNSSLWQLGLGAKYRL